MAIKKFDYKINGVSYEVAVDYAIKDSAGHKIKDYYAPKSDLTSLAARVTTAEGDITSLEGRMSTAESDISSLETSVGSLSTNKVQDVRYNSNKIQMSKNGSTYSDVLAIGLSSGTLTVGTSSKYIPSVVDNMTSTSTADALSAKQGKELKTLIDAVDGILAARVVGSDIEYSVSGDTGKIKLDTINMKTGAAGTTQEATISLANSSAAGLMSYTDYNALQQALTDISALKGQTVRLLYTAKENPTAAEIQAFVTAQGYDQTKWPGVAVVVAGTYHIWHYYGATTGWKDDGKDTVSAFTNSVAGVIKGTDGVAGKVFAENDGTGSVYGWDALVSRVDSAEDGLGDLDERMESAEGDISSLGTRMTAAEGDISSLGTRMTTAEGNISDLQDGLEQAQEDIHDLEGEVNTHSGDISSLQSGKLDKKTTTGDYLYSHSGTTQGEIAIVKNQGETGTIQIVTKAYVDAISAAAGQVDGATLNGTAVTKEGKTLKFVVDKNTVSLGNVVNTGDSATPVSGGTTKFTTGGAYTELAKKIDKNTLSAKGDILYASAANTPAKLAIGSAGQVLTVENGLPVWKNDSSIGFDSNDADYGKLVAGTTGTNKGLGVFDDRDQYVATVLACHRIVDLDEDGEEYVMALPQKSGTFALTSDVTAANIGLIVTDFTLETA